MMRLKKKNNWFKDLFEGFLKRWEFKLIVGIVYTMVGIMAIMLISLAWEVFLLVALFFAVAYTVGHFIVREW